MYRSLKEKQILSLGAIATPSERHLMSRPSAALRKWITRGEGNPGEGILGKWLVGSQVSGGPSDPHLLSSGPTSNPSLGE